MLTDVQRVYRREYNKAWAKRNPEKHRESAKKAYLKDKRVEYRKRYYRDRKLERQLYMKEYYYGNKRAQRLKYNFNITPEEYEKLLDKQEGCCAICNSCTPNGGNSKKYFSVDHNHITGKVRGLLCGSCNQGLGRFKDSIELLQRAASYLKSSILQ